MERSDILAWRKARRAELIAARLAIPAPAHKAASDAIAASLRAFLAARGEHLIGAYWPFRREFNIIPVLEALVAAGREAALPVVLGKGMPLEFRLWRKDTKLATGIYDIPYPAEGPAVRPEALIVPLVGFDEGGYRLGYGGGFYDRTLATYTRKPLCIGVGFELGRHATIHPLPHDIPMDWIVTEAGFFKREASGLARA
jgi:5-formyltetrahydrofolate cyclo-ligase